MASLVGQQFGNYRLVRLLGQGSFAEVYQGEHILLGTNAAIKILKGQLSPQDKQQFLDEARNLANLKHPHIVPLLDFGVEGSTPFMVMDYAQNGTLLQHHPIGTILPLSLIVSYVKDIAAALQYAHDRKLIHRDVKPENILFNAQNEVWLSDFSIAVIAHNTSSQPPQTQAGTALYMAPEQINSYPRPASDQYALGVIVYMWLTGSFPFTGATYAEIIGKHLHVPPLPLRAKVPTISPALEQVVLTALAKDPKLRFASVQIFAEALEQASLAVPGIVPTQAGGQLPSAFVPTLLPFASDTLYKEGAIARASGDLERATSLWQQILDRNPNYQNGTLVPQMQNLREELRLLQKQRAKQQAIEARKVGDWQQEINALNTFLRLIYGIPQEGTEKYVQEARERIPVATINLQFAWMYENAQQFLRDGNRDAARTTLQELWRHAPYYGDPAGLAKRVGLRVPPNYEHAKVRTSRSQLISKIGYSSAPLIYFCILSLVGGLGSTVGMLSQSWFWAIGTVGLTALLSYVSLYRKMVNVPSMLCIAVIGGLIAFACAWYASTLHYDQFQIAHLWLLGTRKMVIANQLYCGIGISFWCSLVTLGANMPDEGLGLSVFFVSALAVCAFLIIWLLLMLVGTIFGWGFGFGFGWDFSFVTGLLLIVFNSIGLSGYLGVFTHPSLY